MKWLTFLFILLTSCYNTEEEESVTVRAQNQEIKNNPNQIEYYFENDPYSHWDGNDFVYFKETNEQSANSDRNTDTTNESTSKSDRDREDP